LHAIKKSIIAGKLQDKPNRAIEWQNSRFKSGFWNEKVISLS
jgi:hypothetical protein